MTSAPQRLFIIDAMALFFRSFYALGRSSSLATSNGQPTGAVYGTALFMNKLLNEQRPDYLIAVTDTDEPTFRHTLYADYKGQRDKMPDDLAAQLPHCFRLMESYGCPLLRLPGFEADDLIGTMAVRFSSPSLHTYIVSGDKDFMQLISDQVFMFAPKKNEEAVIIDRAAVREKFHCTPEQVIDALALIGDTVDNVPGVRGIGEKGAAKLIETYSSLDGIYAHLDELSPKLRENLSTNRADAYLSRQLVTLKTNVDLPLTLAQVACDWRQAAASTKLLDFFQEFEFKSLAQKVRSTLPKGSAETVSTAAPAAPSATAVTAIASISQRSQLYDALAPSQAVALVVSASGTDVITDRAQSLTLYGDQAAVFTVALSEEGIYLVRDLLMSKQTKVMHGYKAAFEMLENVGLELGGDCIDLEICDYLLDPNHYDHSLASMSGRYLQSAAPEQTDVGGTAKLIMSLHRHLQPLITKAGLTKVLMDVEMPLVPVLARMERAGVYIDAEQLSRYSDELSHTAKKLEQELYTAAGGPFNIASPKQLQEVLFERLKLQDVSGTKLKRTKTGYSTDESVLTLLAHTHAVPQLIIAYREVTKLKNTYVDSLPQYINPRTQRVHTSFRQTVAATGRLSSDRPNLQNIPIQSALGKRIRQAFQAQTPGTVLISADYSQVELRLLAHLSEATDMIEAFKKGLDVHTVTAAKIFGVAESAVTPALRSRAKAVNFGIIYGMGPQRLAATTGVTLGEAREFIKRYFEVYPRIRAYTQGLIAVARQTGYCVTMLGRRRPIPEIGDQNKANQARGENIAVNAPIQGSAADLIKLAMIRIDRVIAQRHLQTRMVLQVHDELVFSAPHGEVDEAKELIREHMEHAFTTSVPLKVDIRSGHDWLEAH